MGTWCYNERWCKKIKWLECIVWQINHWVKCVAAKLLISCRITIQLQNCRLVAEPLFSCRMCTVSVAKILKKQPKSVNNQKWIQKARNNVVVYWSQIPVIIAMPFVKFTSFPPDIVDSSLSKGISSCSWTLMHIDGAEAITKMKIKSTYNQTSWENVTSYVNKVFNATKMLIRY